MTFDSELILIGAGEEYGEDDVGNQIPVEVERTVLCDEQSVSRAEFYSAAKAGLKPVRIFVIHGFEYEEEEFVKFDGIRYKVLKTYQVNFEDLELTCKKE